MSTRLVILGLLRDRPLYGYELKQIIEEHMGDWTNIAFGSIYYALGKLDEEGLIEQVAVEQEGRRPSRSVYQITAAGQAEFLRLLREVWGEVERHYYALDIGLVLLHMLHDALQLGDPVPQIAPDLFAGQRRHEYQSHVDVIVVALDFTPHPAQQLQKLGPARLGDPVDRARGPAALLLCAHLLDKARLGQFAQGIVDRAKGDVGPITHVLFDDLLQFVAVQWPVAQKSQDHQLGRHAHSLLSLKYKILYI